MRWIVAGILLAVLAGCGSDRVPTYPVRGRVQFSDGDPVRLGTVELESLEFGTTASGKIRDDGSFVLGTYTPTDGAAAGKHRVIVVQIIVSDGTFEHTLDHGQPVPRRYCDYETSQLSAAVEATEQNELLIELSPE